MLAAAGAVSRIPTFLAKFRQYFCQEPEGATHRFTEKLPGGGEMPVTWADIVQMLASLVILMQGRAWLFSKDERLSSTI